MEKKLPAKTENPILPVVWITKYALTEGITRIENVERCDEISDRMIVFTNARRYRECYHKPHWHETLTDAMAQAEKMRVGKIRNMERQIAKLKAMTIKVPSIVALIVFIATMAGCASGAKTWPEVVDGHIIISAIVVCWLAMCVAWLLRGAPRFIIATDAKKE